MTFEVMFISCITLTSNCVHFVRNEMNLGHLYRALRLRASATQSEIKSAYYRLCQIYHPDKAKDSSNSVQRFRLINNAYQALMKALTSNKSPQTKILYENPGEFEAKEVEKETRKFRFQLNRGRKVQPPAQDTVFDPQLDQRIQSYRSLAFKK